jgi:hypothetical protein
MMDVIDYAELVARMTDEATNAFGGMPATSAPPDYPTQAAAIEPENRIHYNAQNQPMPYVSWVLKGTVWVDWAVDAMQFGWEAQNQVQFGIWGGTARTTFDRYERPRFTAFASKHGQSGARFMPRDRYRPGRLDSTAWLIRRDKIMDYYHGNFVTFYDTFVPPFVSPGRYYPLKRVNDGPEGIGRDVPNILPGSVWVGDWFIGKCAVARANLDAEYAALLNSRIPWAVTALGEKWKPFAAGTQTQGRGP